MMFPYGNTGRITGHFLTTIDINVKNLYCRIICCHNFHCCCRQGCNHFLGERVRGGRGGGSGPPTFLSPSQFWTAFNVGDRFNSFVLNVFVFFERSIFQDFSFNYSYTRLNDLKFEIPKIIWRAHRAPSPNPSPALSQTSASIPQQIEHFSVIIWTATDRNV